MIERKDDYDDEPVKYCPRCYSLKIAYEQATDTEYCMECGCLDIAETTIEEWTTKYEKRYGKKYVTPSDDVRTSPIFKFSAKKLKSMVFNHPSWKNIIHSLYPNFPKNLDKTDSILLLFNMLVGDNRLDDLRMLLLKIKKKVLK